MAETGHTCTHSVPHAHTSALTATKFNSFALIYHLTKSFSRPSVIMFTLSLNQLLTILNMVSEEHVTEASALGMLAELGVVPRPPLNVSSPRNPLPSASHGRSARSPFIDPDVCLLAAGIQRSLAIQDTPARGRSASSTTSTPSRIRTKAPASTGMEMPPPSSLRGGAIPSEERNHAHDNQTVTDFSPPLPPSRPSRPSAYAEQGGTSGLKTTVGSISADFRWYCVTRGEKIGAVQGW